MFTRGDPKVLGLRGLDACRAEEGRSPRICGSRGPRAPRHACTERKLDAHERRFPLGAAATGGRHSGRIFRLDIPSQARIDDYLLSGKANYPEDPWAGDEIAIHLPNIRQAFGWNST